MSQLVMQVQDESVNLKETSGLGKLFKKLTKFIGKHADLNAFWRTARGALDALSLSAGVPLAELRQQYRNEGTDPNKLDEWLSEQWESGIPDAATVNNQLAEGQVKFPAAKTSDMLMWIGGALALIVIVGGLGSKKGRGFMRKTWSRVRSWRPRFRGFRRGRRR